MSLEASAHAAIRALAHCDVGATRVAACCSNEERADRQRDEDHELQVPDAEPNDDGQQRERGEEGNDPSNGMSESPDHGAIVQR